MLSTGTTGNVAYLKLDFIQVIVTFSEQSDGQREDHSKLLQPSNAKNKFWLYFHSI